MLTLKLKRLEAGLYESEDGRVRIQRHVCPQSYGPAEVSWSVEIDGKYVGYDCDTKKDAVQSAIRKLTSH